MQRPLHEKERIAWMVLSVVLLFGCLTTVIKVRREAATAERRLKIMFEREAALRDNIKLLNLRIENIQGAALTDYAVQNLKKQGFKQPAWDLFRDLDKHPELIPDMGALWGREAYYHPDESRILSDRWYLGGFRKGHRIYGKALFQYKVFAGGKVSWKMLDASWRDIKTGQTGELRTH